MILIIFLYFVLALSFVIAKIALNFCPPLYLIGIRMSIAGILLLSYQYLFKKYKFLIPRDDWMLFFKTTLFHIYLAFVLEFWALQYLTSAKTNLIYSVTPFMASILSYFLLSEKLGFLRLLNIGLGFVGLLPILISRSTALEGVTLFRFSLAEIILLFAVFSSVYAWFLIKRLMAKGYPLSFINGTCMLLGGLLALITAPFFETLPNLTGKMFSYIFLLIFLSNIIVYNLYGWLLHTYSITFLTFAGFLCPLFGSVLGYVLLGENISWHYFLSLFIVSCALLIFYFDNSKY